MAGVIEKNVLGLQVTAWETINLSVIFESGKDKPIDHIEPVKMFQRTEKFRSIKTAAVFVKLALALKMIE